MNIRAVNIEINLNAEPISSALKKFEFSMSREFDVGEEAIIFLRRRAFTTVSEREACQKTRVLTRGPLLLIERF